jgi:hypothetical protein
MNFIHYKFIKLYSISYILKEKKNMVKTIKLAPAIILFILLFFITKGDDTKGIVFSYSPIKCRSSRDCPDIYVGSNAFASICIHGNCVKSHMDPKYVNKHHT